MQAKSFMDQDFLLSTETAKRFYHDWAEKMPVLDYHCHIDPKEIAEDRKFETITQVWLGGDHYKWRQMRSNGVDEAFITGRAPDREKFQKWAETLEMAAGNPLYHWSHLELRRYFGYNGYLNGETAKEVWNLCNEKLKEDSMSVRNLIRRYHVTLLCTTDDPVDDLRWHKAIAHDPGCEFQVLPAWRPDRAMHIEKPDYADYLKELGEAGGMTVMDLLDYISQNIDPSLGYYRHSVCNHGVCGRCLLRVNGKPVLACIARVRDYGGDLLLQPAEGAQAIRDLVISV